MSKRKAITKRTRFEVFKRDEFTCQYCGRRPPQVMLQVDHVVPVAAGGDNDPLNLTTSCHDCNLGKSDKRLEATLPNQRDELAKRKELAEQTAALNEFLATHREEQDAAIQRLAVFWVDQKALPSEPQGEWIAGQQYRRSIRTFLKSLPEFEIIEAMEIAHGRFPVEGLRAADYKTWKYFCGICWRKIKADHRHEGDGQ